MKSKQPPKEIPEKNPNFLTFLSRSFFSLLTLHNTMSSSLDGCIFRSTPEMFFFFEISFSVNTALVITSPCL